MTSSIREYDSLPDRLRLHFRGDKTSIILVEGPSDELLLKDFWPVASIFIADGRKRLLAVSQALHSMALCRFVAVYDQDFDPPPPPFGSDLDNHLHPYDGRDLEGMLVKLGAWHKLVDVRGSKSKLQKAGGPSEALAKAFNIVKPISRLRQANAHRQLGLPFDSIELRDKIDRKAIELRLTSYCTALLSKCSTDVTVSDLMSISNGPADLAPRGKDVLEVTSSFLRGWIGSLDSKLADPDLLAGELIGFSQHLVYGSSWLGDLTRKLQATKSERVCLHEIKPE